DERAEAQPARGGSMAATKPAVHITRIRTIGVPVADQDRALRFYVETLGFEKRLDVPFAEGDRWIEVAPPGSATTIALVRVRKGVDTQVGLSTTDATADHAALRARGVDADAEVIPRPVPMFGFRDPDGNRLRIVQGD